MLTRRSFVKVMGAVAWCVAFLRPLPTATMLLDHDEVFEGKEQQEGTLYMSQDASRGVVLPLGHEIKWRGVGRFAVERFARAKEAYVVRVNQPLDIRTLVGLAAKRNR